MSTRIGPALAALLGLAVAVPAGAGELQHLELGAGAGLLIRPDYRGSRQVSTTLLPVPYMDIDTKHVVLTREGLVARLFNADNVRLGLSASAALPGKQSDDSARRGMPHILPTFEIGPSLEWTPGGKGSDWRLMLPVRAVAATNLKEFDGIGWLAYPHVEFDHGLMLGGWEIETAAGGGPLWAARAYHRYFYGVAPRYATPDRPAYDPSGGYSGARATAYLGLHRGPWHMAFGITHDWLAGAEIDDSPLVETKHATTVAVGIFWTFWTWEAKAPGEAD